MVSVALSSHPLTKEQNGFARLTHGNDGMVNEIHLFCSLYFRFGADTETISVLNVYGYGIYRMQWVGTGKWETHAQRQAAELQLVKERRCFECALIDAANHRTGTHRQQRMQSPFIVQHATTKNQVWLSEEERQDSQGKKQSRGKL